MGRKEFTQGTTERALIRQKNSCGSYGEEITSLRQDGKLSHRFGDAAHAHHMKHDQQQGSNNLSNRVILCESCHYNVHEGGNYKNDADYLIGTEADYPHYHG